MRLFNWAQSFKQQPTCEDILNKVRETEIWYWIFVSVSVLVALAGANLITGAPDDNIKQHSWGIFLSIVGVVNIAVIKLWAHTRLTMYYIIWDSQNRIESEIAKSQAQDL